jgi:hypothetical protein
MGYSQIRRLQARQLNHIRFGGMTAMRSVMESPADAELVEIDEGNELGAIAG